MSCGKKLKEFFLANGSKCDNAFSVPLAKVNNLRCKILLLSCHSWSIDQKLFKICMKMEKFSQNLPRLWKFIPAKFTLFLRIHRNAVIYETAYLAMFKNSGFDISACRTLFRDYGMSYCMKQSSGESSLVPMPRTHPYIWRWWCYHPWELQKLHIAYKFFCLLSFMMVSDTQLIRKYIFFYICGNFIFWNRMERLNLQQISANIGRYRQISADIGR